MIELRVGCGFKASAVYQPSDPNFDVNVWSYIDYSKMPLTTANPTQDLTTYRWG